jgi:predicted transglutaminase-like protease
MQKFTEFVNEHKAAIASKAKADAAVKFNELYEAKLKEFNASSPIDLNEEQSKEFYEYLKTLNTKMPINEADVKDEKTFREYAESVLRKAHPKDYDEKIANKVIDDIASEVKDGDWGAAIGKLTSGLGK